MLRPTTGTLALTTALLLAACSSDGGSSKPGGAAPQDAGLQPGGCRSESDCARGEVCFNDECRAGECSPTHACPIGRTCDLTTLTCADGAGAGCSSNDDCQGTGYCIDGHCQNVACVDDMQCNPGETCTDQHRCVPQLAQCVDADHDGYGAGCMAGPDCDDSHANVNPGVTEDGTMNCDDGVDNDCHGGDAVCGEVDGDGDGVTDKAGDCDDHDPNVNPQHAEVFYNGKDDDCNPGTRDDDQDMDGFRASDVGGDDCDDRAPHINPGARDVPGNGVDEDCDGMDRVAGMGDVDGDGVSEAQGDCDDDNADVHPGAQEVPYNGVDDDCDAATRDNDIDQDGFPAPMDCDDANPAVNPNAREVFHNGLDDDCNAATSDGDSDGDGFAGGPGGPDCNDDAANVHPGAQEVPYNGADDDCDPATRDDDLDGDGVPRAQDCDDNDPDINPNVTENGAEHCDDGVDNDCRGGDAHCGGGVDDSDGDGVPDDQDCAPDDPARPAALEVPNNGVDDDCDPGTPDACEDDAFDGAGNNGTADTASGVEDGNTNGVQYGELVVCPNDDDWYRIDAQAGDGLEADIFFSDAEGDIDMQLYKRGDDGSLVYVDGSFGVGDTETVYERRAPTDATYYVHVYGFHAGRTQYGMTVNVFTQCTDDAVSFDGEHNDALTEAAEMPEIGQTRQVCDYDDDWYTFDVQRRQNVRLDLLFTHAAGDVDMELYRDGQDDAVARSVSSDDDEEIEMPLDPGTYYVRVYGFAGAQNHYRLFRTSGQSATERHSKPGGAVQVPDWQDGEPGVATVDLDFDPPAGAVIRRVTVRDLDINHSWLPDLRVIAQWNGEDVAVLWDRQGDANGGDGGLDDDFLPFTGGDINFDNRVYREFEGLPAGGTFTLRVEDQAPGDTGEIANLDVEIEYLLP
jgi:hypothetical protein